MATSAAVDAVADCLACGMIQCVPDHSTGSRTPVLPGGRASWSPISLPSTIRPNVAPFSWAVSDHVESGRSKLNFSEFDRPQDDADEAAEVTEDGEMPPGYYTRFGLHSAAALSDDEVARLVAGFKATPGLSDDD